jgi:tetratricopeptide (TPR) repeat protein
MMNTMTENSRLTDPSVVADGLPRFVGCEMFRHAALGILHHHKEVDRQTTATTISSTGSFQEDEADSFDEVVPEIAQNAATNATSLPPPPKIQPRFRESFWDLPHQIQQLLQRACLISLGQESFHQRVLEVLANHDHETVDEGLKVAQEWGWIRPTCDDGDRDGEDWFGFSPDNSCDRDSRILEQTDADDPWPLIVKKPTFAHSLVFDIFELEGTMKNQEEEVRQRQHQQQECHLEIGRALWTPLVEGQLPLNILPAKLVAQQLVAGSSHIHDQEECYAFARLYLRTGETIVAEKDNFEAASRWFQEGIRLLHRDRRRHWHDAYSTSLDLYNAAAEAAYCCGELETAEELCQEILSAGRFYPNCDPLDNLRASTLLVYKCGTEHNLSAAIEQGLSIIKELRVGFPPRGGLLSIPFQLAWVKRRMEKLSDQDIMTMPPLTDPRYLGALRIMVIILEYALHSQPMLVPQMAFWMLRVMLTRGMSVMTCDGMAVLGLLCCNYFNEFDLGQRAARLSLKILEIFKGDDYVARCATPVYMFCLTYTMPLRALLKPMSDAAHIGFGRGDMECASLCASLHVAAMLIASIPIAEAMTTTHDALQKMIVHKQDRVVTFTLPSAQFLHNLLGHSADPSVLNGRYMDCDRFIKDCQEKGNNSAVAGCCQARLGIEVLLGDFGKAAVTSRLLEGLDSPSSPPFLLTAQYQDQAVTALAQCRHLARHGKSLGSRLRRRRHIRFAKRKITGIEQLCQHSDIFLPNLYVAQGEMLALCGKTEKALEKFHLAISLSKGECNYMVIGFAQWRAAVALVDANRTNEASTLLRQAADTYRTWGAVVLVDFMEKELCKIADRENPADTLPTS